MLIMNKSMLKYAANKCLTLDNLSSGHLVSSSTRYIGTGAFYHDAQFVDPVRENLLKRCDQWVATI